MISTDFDCYDQTCVGLAINTFMKTTFVVTMKACIHLEVINLLGRELCDMKTLIYCCNLPLN